MSLIDGSFFKWKKIFVRSVHLLTVLFMTASMFIKDTDLKTALDERDYAYFVPYLAMVYLSLLFYFLTCLTSPGYVKRKMDPDQSMEDLERSQSHHSEETESPRSAVPDQPFEPAPAIKLRFCDICKINQPIRSRHCEECGRCIRKFDHHCPWLETCIGERNHGYFWAFLFVTNILVGWTSVLVCQAFYNYSPWTLWMYHNSYLVLCMVILVVSFFICTALFAIHTYFMFNNTTTWERFSRKNITYLKIINDEKLNPFYENCCRNVAHFFQCTFCTSLGSGSHAGSEATSEDETTRWESIYLRYLKKKKVISKDIERIVVTHHQPQSPLDPSVGAVPVAESASASRGGVKRSTSMIQMDRVSNDDDSKP